MTVVGKIGSIAKRFGSWIDKKLGGRISKLLGRGSRSNKLLTSGSTSAEVEGVEDLMRSGLSREKAEALLRNEAEVVEMLMESGLTRESAEAAIREQRDISRKISPGMGGPTPVKNLPPKVKRR